MIATDDRVVEFRTRQSYGTDLVTESREIRIVRRERSRGLFGLKPQLAIPEVLLSSAGMVAARSLANSGAYAPALLLVLLSGVLFIHLLLAFATPEPEYR